VKYKNKTSRFLSPEKFGTESVSGINYLHGKQSFFYTLIVPQVVKNFRFFYGTGMLNTVSTTDRQ
jgi:hypothetical protein